MIASVPSLSIADAPRGIGVFWGVLYPPHPLALAIASVTGSFVSHAGVIFLFRDGEAAFPACYEAKTTGFRGPVHLRDIVSEWTGPLRNFHIRWLPDVPYYSVTEKFRRAHRWAYNKQGYDWLAILQIWLHARLGLPPIKHDERKLICSEAVARLIYPEYDVRFGGTFDLVTPGYLFREINRLLCVKTSGNTISAT